MPVLETLGGALFGAVLQVLFDKLDSRQVLDYFRGRKLHEKLLKILRRKLVSINAVVDDAEQKQFRNPYVKAWLDEVRDVLLDTEDLLEEIDYEFSRSESEHEYQSGASKVSSLESKLKEVIDGLESLLNQKDDLGLKNTSGVGVGLRLSSNVSQKLPSTSLVVENVIYGRGDEKEMIFKWMTSDTEKHSQLSILSVVGMGGLGKTTLAQHMYNDPMIEGKFDIKGWVCVSDKFDVFMVTKAIVGAITKSKDDSVDLEMAQGRLKEKLTGSKFLLVLDNVWNEDRDQWKALQTPLNFGAKGSKVLVTTRSNKVASIVQSNKVHELKQLGGDHSWQVFAKKAFQDDNQQMNGEVKEIGTKRVERCKGLPLALETVGCLLRSKSSVAEWKSVLRSEIWEFPEEDSKIIPALLLSYYHLPSPLKRCFSYCAIFPKDFRFNKNNLIQLWMAENFLQCSQQSKSPEEVGEHYLNVLLSRSFFQQSSGAFKSCFVMHDLLNDLAKYVSGEICYRLGVDRPGSVPKTTRHFSTLKNPVEYNEYRSLWDAKRLRTFLSIFIYGMSIEEMISNFKFLRVLCLCSSHIIEVPDTIGDLIHLRSLDLSVTRIERLPDSIGSLRNLQVLKLNVCSKLRELPLTLSELPNLRCLELEGTTLREVPVLLEKLKNLQVWNGGFEVGKSGESSIQQLGQLDLHGELSIKNLENIVNACDALAADLKNKTHLVGLRLEWRLKRNNEDSIKEREALENLQPSRHLEESSISDYGGTQFPRWLSDNCLCNVVSLTLERCKYCLWLPSLGLLTSLKYLKIKGLDEIVRIDSDFYGNTSSAFPYLETLSFIDMKEWEEWQCMTGAFPNLESLSVRNCPKLRRHLPEHLPHLKYLCIVKCEQIVDWIPRAVEIEGLNMESYSFEYLIIYSCPGMNIHINHCFHFLKELRISQCCDSLTTFPLDLFPKLSILELDECRNLQMISQGHPHSHLKNLKIKKCSEFESFPNEGLFAPQLEALSIKGMEKLKSLPKCMSALLPSLNKLCIHDCPGVEFSDECLPSNLSHMKLLNCSKLVASLKGALGVNPSLEILRISDIDVESFPDEGLLPLSLTELEIDDCPNLKKLEYKGLCHLSSLQKLILDNCPILQCLPEEGLPKSISALRILGCPLLEQRCRKGGEDREKIAHIKSIEF